MSKNNKNMVGGRIASAIIMMLFGVFCLITLSQGFTIWFLLLGLGALGIGVYNILKVLSPTNGSKATKRSKDKDEFTL